MLSVQSGIFVHSCRFVVKPHERRQLHIDAAFTRSLPQGSRKILGFLESREPVRATAVNVVVQIPDLCLARVGVDFRGNLGLGVGVGLDVCVCLAFGLRDGVAVTVVVGVGVGLAVAVEGSTLLSLVSAWAHLPSRNQ